MWANPAAGAPAAGYRDPTTLFEESGSSSSATSSSLSSSTVGAEDYRTLQNIAAVAPGLLAAAPRPSKWNHLFHLRHHHHRRGTTPAELTPAEQAALDERRRQQQEHIERHFFRDRGALDFQRSAVFGCVTPPTDAAAAAAAGADAEAEVWAGAEWPSPTPPAAAAFGGGVECVPVELQAWYVASNVSPAIPSHPCTSHTRGAAHNDDDALSTRDDEPPSAWDLAAAAAAAAAVAPVVRSSGAGTTSVNVLRSRTAPGQALRSTSPPPPPPAESRGEGTLMVDEKKRKRTQTMAADAADGNAAAPPDSNPFSVIKESSGDNSGNSSGSISTDLKQDVDADAAMNESAAHVTIHTQTDGGRPPLRAHRYVEQPNGVFISHAKHASLLAQYALSEQLRYTQQKAEARRARRWSRLLHGNDATRLDRSGGAAAAAAAVPGGCSAAAALCTRYHWLYDAATYRRRYISVLRYMQRVHVCLVGVAAGVSLVTLIGLTIPFPSVAPGQVEDGLPRDVRAVLLLAMMTNSTASLDVASLPLAYVLPVLQQGHPAFAVFIALLQPYHASLLLFLGLLMLITGYAPVPWGVAERYWMVQRQRWLRHDEAAGQDTAAAAALAATDGGNSRGSFNYYYNTDDDDDDDEREWSGTSGTRNSTQPPSPFAHTFDSTSLAPRHSIGAGGGGGYASSDEAVMRGAIRTRAGRNPRRLPSYFAGPPPHPPPLMTSTDLRLGMSTGGGGGGTLNLSPLRSTYDGPSSATRHGGGRRRFQSNVNAHHGSVLLGMTRGRGGVNAAAGGYADSFGAVGASFSAATPPPRGGGRSVSVTDFRSSANDVLLMNSSMSFGRSGYHYLHPHHSYAPNSGGGGGAFLAGTTNAPSRLGLSPPASVTDTSLQPPPHMQNAAADIRDGRDASSTSGCFSSAAARSLRGTLSAMESRYTSAAQPAATAPLLLLLPAAATLEGHFSADNACSHTFDYVERRVTQWLCNTLARLYSSCRRCCGCGDDHDDDGDADDSSNSRGKQQRQADARHGVAGLATLRVSKANRRRPAMPVSVYLHVLLQPRLWCLVVALALTLVELAVVDERSVELLWRAQPASWWSKDALSGVLPHRWLRANFAEPSAVNTTPPPPSPALATSHYRGVVPSSEVGHVERVLMAVYATRTAMIWLALLLNLFF